MNSFEIIELIRQRFNKTGNPTQIPKLKNGTFTAEMTDQGIEVGNLGNQPFLPWIVFQETFSLLIRKGGIADRGNAMGSLLGDEKLSFDSVEGHVARVVYGKQSGQLVFRRITPIACILIWAGICEHVPRQLKLKDFT